MEGKYLGSVISRSPSSLRDPAGFIFTIEDSLYRTVNYNHKRSFDLLFSSGFYDHLVEKGLLIEHEKASYQFTSDEIDIYQVLKLKKLPFISYPTEWCFGQLKAAALFTLELQSLALDYGMTLKDASAFNVQYNGVRPIFIDILSLEEYEESSPWLAYEQFCRHFLAPLALMSYRDERLQQLLRIHMDGLPLDLTAELLPFKSYFNLSLLTNIILQAKAQQWFSKLSLKSTPVIKKEALKALINNLHNLIEHLELPSKNSTWKNYYEDACIYSKQAMISKIQIVEQLINKAKPAILWDIGSNDGKFSRIANSKNIYTVSMDADHNSVQSNYLKACKNNESCLLPLLMDLVNPSPAQGWSSCETKSLIERGPADTILALALIHHLVITNSLSLASISACFAAMGKNLIIEFVPVDDLQVLKLLSAKPMPLFEELYNIDVFERELKRHFLLVDQIKIEDSGRIIYLAQKH